MSTCTVNFNTGTLTGAILPNAKLVFRSTDAPLRPVGALVAPADRYEVTADAGGAGSVTLAWGNWTVTMMASDGQKVAPFSVPQAASARLEDLLGAPLTSVYTTLDLVATGIAGARLFATTAAALLATRAGEVFLAPLLPNGMGVYRTIQPAANMQPGSAQQVGAFFNGTVTATTTDTTAGRLLKVGDFGLGSVAIAPTVTDISDTSTPAGFYRTIGTTTGVFPTHLNGTAVSKFGYLLVERYGDGNLAQKYMSLAAGGPANKTFTRVYNSATSVWTSWAESYTSANILGPVSVASGVPTGAIIERGSNANGEFVRFADGTQICTRTNLSIPDVNTALGALFRTSANIIWTFPAPFSAAPAVSGDLDDPHAWMKVGGAPAPTGAVLRGMSAEIKTVAINGRATAIGRWF